MLTPEQKQEKDERWQAMAAAHEAIASAWLTGSLKDYAVIAGLHSAIAGHVRRIAEIDKDA